ncbi:uncharacterized protein LOC141830216 [Curcuma longa]|uniref:uncharacterized protein LOC141830216 n=1 Tax=Curcuma longa TaxID=136217 RepID=UPI003D9DDE96
MASTAVAFAAAPVNFSATRRRRAQLCSFPPTSRRPATFFPCATTSSKIPPFGPKVYAVGFFDPLSHGVSSSSSSDCVAGESTAAEWKSSGTRRLFLGALVWKAVAFACYVGCGACLAADDSIRASGLGLKVATTLRRLGLADELVVFALATLPVLELRGAIPVGYWMQLHPLALTLLAILGNMVPVPFIILYLKKLASFFLSRKSGVATRFVNLLFERAKAKAVSVEEFRWLGLMLFVAVPFPGTGAWTGAAIASILDMPFSSAFSANLVGVVLAGLLVNLLVNLGLKYAILTGLFLFFVSTVMWSILRSLKKSSN